MESNKFIDFHNTSESQRKLLGFLFLGHVDDENMIRTL